MACWTYKRAGGGQQQDAPRGSQARRTVRASSLVYAGLDGYVFRPGSSKDAWVVSCNMPECNAQHTIWPFSLSKAVRHFRTHGLYFGTVDKILDFFGYQGMWYFQLSFQLCIHTNELTHSHSGQPKGFGEWTAGSPGRRQTGDFMPRGPKVSKARARSRMKRKGSKVKNQNAR